jgi:hypothetical protein
MLERVEAAVGGIFLLSFVRSVCFFFLRRLVRLSLTAIPSAHGFKHR